MMRRRVAGGVLLLALGIFPTTLHAKKGASLPTEVLPAWARGAAARPTPAGAAGIALLHDERIVEPLADGGVRITTRQLFRALDSTGVEALGTVALHHSKDDVIEAHRAWTLLPSGEVRAPDPKDDVSDLPYSASGFAIDDARLHVIRVPAMSVGALLVEESILREAIDFGADDFLFGRTGSPVAVAHYEVRVPEGFHVEALKQRAEALTDLRGERSIALTGKDLAALPPANLRPSADELLPLVWVRWWSDDGTRGFADWNAVARWSEKLGEPAVAEPGEATVVGDRIKPADPGSLLDAIERAHDFAAREVRYVAIEVGIGGWAPTTPAKTCTLRHGDCKAKAWLLRSLASRWGTEVFPVLVRTMDRGHVLRDVPTPAQFNHVIAAVVLPAAVGADLWAAREVEIPGRGKLRVLFVDATESMADAFTLPDMDQGTIGLVLHGGGGVLVDLPMQPAAAATYGVSLSGRLGADGLLEEGTLRQTWGGASGPDQRSRLSGQDETRRLEQQREALQWRLPGASLLSYSVEGQNDVREDIVATTKVTGARLGKKVGPLLIVAPGGLVGGMAQWDLPPPPRAWPVILPSPHVALADLDLALPAGRVPEELPAPLELTTPQFSVKSAFAFTEGRLTWHREARVLVREVAPEQYAAFRDAVMKVRSHESAGIVLIETP